MKTYINISNVPVEVAEKVKAIAESEFDGNESAAYRKLLAEALEARAKKQNKGGWVYWGHKKSGLSKLPEHSDMGLFSRCNFRHQVC